MSEIGFKTKRFALVKGMQMLIGVAAVVRIAIPKENLGEFDKGLDAFKVFISEFKEVQNEEEAEACFEKFSAACNALDPNVKWMDERITEWKRKLRYAEDQEQKERIMAIIQELEVVQKQFC